MQPCALWYNMREEVVVYINGQPFVLREDGRPFKNMEVGSLCCGCCVAARQLCALPNLIVGARHPQQGMPYNAQLPYDSPTCRCHLAHHLPEFCSRQTDARGAGAKICHPALLTHLSSHVSEAVRCRSTQASMRGAWS